MSTKEFLFADWRPIASVPIFVEELSSSDWRTADLSNLKNLEIVGDISDIQLEYRYVCRSDGIILFQIRSVDMELRAATSIAYAVSHRIKEHCGHCHVFDADHWSAPYSDLTSLPVLCEPARFDTFAELQDFTLDDAKIKELNAVSVNSGSISDRKALLTIKKLYSRLFDRVSRRVNFHDKNVSAWKSSSFTPKGTAIAVLSALASLVLILALMWANFHFDWRAAKEIVLGTFFLCISVIVLGHVRHNISTVLHGKIRLHRRLAAYYSHANNLSRVLWRLYKVEMNTPSNDFDPIINLTEGMIQATIRRINTYVFYFGALTTLLGLFLAIV